MRRSYPILLCLIALAILDDASSFFFPGNPLAVTHWHSGSWRNNQQQERVQDRRLAASMALVFGDLQVPVAGRLTTRLFFNNMPDDEPSATYNDGTGTSSVGSTTTSKAKADVETSTTIIDESARSLVDESPQDKILRIRSGKLTSYEKKAFLESTLQGSRSIRTRTPVVQRIFPRDNTTTSARSGSYRAERVAS
jgi:hypothetical protein